MSYKCSLSILVSPDVASILEREKKRKGREGTRGTYLDKAVRFYERSRWTFFHPESNSSKASDRSERGDADE